MDEFLKAFKERLHSPVLGNFIFSWLIINWKIPYVTFFINPDSLKGHNKIDFIDSLISSYENPLCRLLGFPIVMAVLMVLFYPWIVNGADIVLMYSKGFLRKYIERNQNDFKLISEQNQILYTSINMQLIDFKSNILNKKISLEEIFPGKWKVELFNPHIENFDCIYRLNKFLNDNGTILFCENLEVTSISGNFSGTVQVKFPQKTGDDSLPYYFQIDSREKIRLSPTSGSGVYIKLTWLHISDI